MLRVKFLMRKNFIFVKSLTKVAVLESLTFRLDIIFGILSSMIWIGVPIIFFKVIYLNVNSIAGWSFKECLLLIGIYTLIDSIMMAFLVKSMPRLENDIREGTLDTILLKPINPQLFYFFGSIDFTQFLNGFLGLAIIFYASRGFGCTATQIFLASLASILGGTIYYSLWFLWTISTFWFPTNFGRTDLFLSMIQISRYPSSIYKGTGSLLFNFLIPLGMVASPAALILIRPEKEFIVIIQFLIAVIFVVLDILVWKLGVRKYDGAGR